MFVILVFLEVAVATSFISTNLGRKPSTVQRIVKRFSRFFNKPSADSESVSSDSSYYYTTSSRKLSSRLSDDAASIMSSRSSLPSKMDNSPLGSRSIIHSHRYSPYHERHISFNESPIKSSVARQLTFDSLLESAQHFRESSSNNRQIRSKQSSFEQYLRQPTFEVFLRQSPVTPPHTRLRQLTSDTLASKRSHLTDISSKDSFASIEIPKLNFPITKNWKTINPPTASKLPNTWLTHEDILISPHVVGTGKAGVAFLGFERSTGNKIIVKAMPLENHANMRNLDLNPNEVYQSEVSALKITGNLRGAWESTTFPSASRHPLSDSTYFKGAKSGFLAMPAYDSALPFGSQEIRQRLQTMSATEAKKLQSNMDKAIADFHTFTLVHCDLTPENILIDPKTLDVHLIDFGAARAATPMEIKMETQRASRFMSEIVAAKNKGVKVDFERVFQDL